MAVHWKIPFMSLGGTQYEVRIYDANYTSSTPVTLVGADRPFVTQEDDDDDAFVPIRTQSGYIGIFDDGKDASGNALGADWWRDLIPMGALDRRVEVVTIVSNTATVVWRGFIQPQSFSGEIYNGPQTREFPVCDRLTALKCWDVVPNDNSATNFGGLIYYCFENILGMMSTNFSFGGGAYVDDWLKKRVMWSNFGETDNSGNQQSKYSCYEMLEEICKFFGWTCRCYGDTVYFDMIGNSSWRTFTATNLDALGDGNSYTAGTVASTVRTSLPGDFMSKNNNETYLQGWRKVKVEADVGKVSAIVEYPTDEVWKYFKSFTPISSQAAHSEWLFVKKPVRTTPFYAILQMKHVDLYFNEGNKNVGSQQVHYIANPYIYAYMQERNPHSVPWNNALAVHYSPPSDPTYLFRMLSHGQYWLNDGIIVISGKTQINYEDLVNERVVTYDAYGILTCVLRVGDKFWNGSAWTDTWSSFDIQTGGSDRPTQTEQQEGVGSIWNDHFWNSEYPDYDGCGIPVTGTVGGVIQFSILGFTDLTYNSEADMRQVNITDLKIEFFRKNTEDSANEDETNKYTANGNRLFFNEKEVKTIFTCDNNNQFGTAIITNPDGTYCQTLAYAEGNYSAGQYLANRMAAFGSVRRRMLELEVNGGGVYNPANVLSYGSMQYAPIAISRDWRDDRYTMKFLEVG